MNKGEIWVIDFPCRDRREQSGTRPSVIIGDTGTNLALVVPLTSNLQALTKIPYTLIINKTKNNNLDKDSVALILQLQAIDKKRFILKISSLEENYIKEINDEIKRLLQL